VALVAYDLWKSYGSRTVIGGVNFTLNPGEILGLLGPNGAGKTTIVGMLYGFCRKYSLVTNELYRLCCFKHLDTISKLAIGIELCCQTSYHQMYEEQNSSNSASAPG
jgi:ABC-type lipopolysaccharide export system ATPase subunit